MCGSVHIGGGGYSHLHSKLIFPLIIGHIAMASKERAIDKQMHGIQLTEPTVEEIPDNLQRVSQLVCQSVIY